MDRSHSPTGCGSMETVVITVDLALTQPAFNPQMMPRFGSSPQQVCLPQT